MSLFSYKPDKRVPHHANFWK